MDQDAVEEAFEPQDDVSAGSSASRTADGVGLRYLWAARGERLLDERADGMNVLTALDSSSFLCGLRWVSRIFSSMISSAVWCSDRV